MTPLDLQELRTYEGFPTGAEDLITLLGLSAAAALITYMPGQEFSVPSVVGGGNVLGRRIWERLVWLVGQDAALLLVKNWGGDRLYVPSCRQVEWQYRNDQIRTEYDILTGERGYSNNEACFDIGIRYKQSGRTIERIVNRPSAKKGEASNA